jgi:hypothetical protein
MWCIPKLDVFYVMAMEEVLELYEQAYNPKEPVVCFDETSKQLVAEINQPVPMQRGQVLRYDYEYEGCGSVNFFLFFEPLASWRHLVVTEQRTKADFARQMQWLVDEAYPEADSVHLVLDNLNTHSSLSV